MAMRLTRVLFALLAVAASALKLPPPLQTNTAAATRRATLAGALAALSAAPLSANAVYVNNRYTPPGTEPPTPPPRPAKPKVSGIEQPWSVSQGCDVLKPCEKGASLWGPYASLGAQDPSQAKKDKKAKKKSA